MNIIFIGDATHEREIFFLFFFFFYKTAYIK